MVFDQLHDLRHRNHAEKDCDIHVENSVTFAILAYSNMTYGIQIWFIVHKILSMINKNHSAISEEVILLGTK